MTNKSWVRGSLILVGSNLLSRGLGLGRDALLSRAGGIGIEVDAYNLAFLIPDLLNHILGAGLLSVTLIPLVAPLLQKDKVDGSHRATEVLESIFTWIFLAITLLTVLSFALAPQLLPQLSDQPLSPELSALTVKYTRIILFAQVCFVAGGFFNAWQYMHYSYLIPALAPLLYNGGIIIGGSLSLATGGVEGFCWGVLGGAVTGPLFLQWWASRRLGWKIQLRFRWVPEIKKYLWLTLPFAIGVSMTFSNEFLFRYFGSKNPGDVAALGYGLRMTMALVGVLGGAVGIAAYPYLSELCAKEDYNAVNGVLLRTLVRICVLVLPILPVIWWMAPTLVHLYLGSRIGAEGEAKIVESLRAYMLIALPMSLQMIVNRVWYADQRTWRPALISLLFLVMSFPFYHWLDSWGMVRIPLISAVVCVVQLTCLLGAWFYLYSPQQAAKETEWLRPIGTVLFFALALSALLTQMGSGPSLSLTLALAPFLILGQWVLVGILGGEQIRSFLLSFVRKIRLAKN